ncbi:MAG: hypothetical protein ACE5LQ_02940, partial [Candidatus Bipolaricaulia bacterium]
ITEGEEKVGNETLVRVVKNKVAPPFREARFDIIYGKGILRERDLLRTGEQLGVVKKSGAWYSFNETQLGQGLTNSTKFLAENSDLAEEIAREIRRRAGLLPEEPLSAGAEEPPAEKAAASAAKGKGGDAKR